jgi:hypothetical protein
MMVRYLTWWRLCQIAESLWSNGRNFDISRAIPPNSTLLSGNIRIAVASHFAKTPPFRRPAEEG